MLKVTTTLEMTGQNACWDLRCSADDNSSSVDILLPAASSVAGVKGRDLDECGNKKKERGCFLLLLFSVKLKGKAAENGATTWERQRWRKTWEEEPKEGKRGKRDSEDHGYVYKALDVWEKGG
jgi:hypothetical protein